MRWPNKTILNKILSFIFILKKTTTMAEQRLPLQENRMVTGYVFLEYDLESCAKSLINDICNRFMPADRLRNQFQSGCRPLLRAAINVPVVWKGSKGVVLSHVARMKGVGSDVVQVLLDEGGAKVDCRGDLDETPLMAVALRDDEEAGVEVARGAFVLWWWIRIVLTHTLCCV